MIQILRANLSVIFSMCFIFCFTSCNGNKKTHDSIVGTWEFYNIVADTVKTNSKQNDEIIEQKALKDIREEFANSSMTFDRNLAFRENVKDDPSYSHFGTYTFSKSNKKLSLTDGKSGLLISLDAQIENNELILIINYSDIYNDMFDSELKEINIDPKDFKAEVVKLKVTFIRN